MSDYNFETLNDKEFEILVIDLLSKEFDVHIERFKAGQDQGIDGRFFEGNSNNQTVIIQCKHWVKSGITKLLKECENTEASKVQKLNPSRYIFVTSLPLSAQNKGKILSSFRPYIKTESNILGQEDLNSLFKKHSNIERQHYKLYLSSVSVLNSILANDIIGRSDFHLREIQDFLPKYVRTDNHKKAFKKLEDLGSIIINGQPGIGKTTLAKQLCLDYVSRGYELVVINKSIDEAERVYKPEIKQIFYFDDFLGSNFLSAIENNQDANIVHFIKRVSKDDTKRFILTTRSNILNQGKSISERFEHSNIDRNEYEIRIQSLSEFDKAQILYNHIYFSELNNKFIDQIYIDKRYRKIIEHKNFNPRLIEFITDSVKVNKVVNVEKYWDYIKATLDNPRDIWRGMITNQISDLDRHITMAITLNGSPISESQIAPLLNRLKNCGLDISNSYFSVEDIMQKLTGSVLNRNISNNQATYQLFNPSIADFLISEYSSRYTYIAKVISSLRACQSLSNLESLAKSKIGSLDYERITSELVKLELSSINKPDTYTLKLVSISKQDLNNIKPLILKILKYYPNNLFETFGTTSLEVLKTAVKYNFLSQDDIYLYMTVMNVFDIADYDDFKEVAQIINLISNNESLITLYKEEVVKLLEDMVTDWAIDSYVFEDIYNIGDIDDGSLIEYVEELLKDLNSGFDFDDEDVETIINALDLEKIVDYNRDRDADYHRSEEEYRENRNLDEIMKPSVDPIDDLFQRD